MSETLERPEVGDVIAFRDTGRDGLRFLVVDSTKWGTSSNVRIVKDEDKRTVAWIAASGKVVEADVAIGRLVVVVKASCK